MKLITIFLPVVLSTLVASKSSSFFGGEQRVLDDDQSVPGDNPLQYCQAATTKDILTIDYVNLKPNPPAKGATLTIEAKGNFTQEVVQGSYVNLQVKYGLITLINSKQDLCEQMKNVDEECPLEGEKVIKKNVELPKEIPKGKYTVLADVYTKDDDKVICLEATVHF